MSREHSPLRRAPEQPPCNSEAEALCLNGVFAVPARLAHFDLGPHLVFAEHRAIWRSMVRVMSGSESDTTLWWRTFVDLLRERPWPDVWQLLGVLEWSPQAVTDAGELGSTIFMLAFGTLRRCTAARRRIQAVQEEVTQLWRVPEVAYTEHEKRVVLGLKPEPIIVRVEIA